jgi:hyperosmotically inducible periplasmic protein
VWRRPRECRAQKLQFTRHAQCYETLREKTTMIRALLKVVLLIVVIAAAAAFFAGYRLADGGDEAPVTATRTAPAVDAEKARQTGAAIGETVATGAAEAQRALNEGSLTAKIKSKMALDDTVRAAAIDVDTVGGVVTLSGTVGSQAERARAVQLARETAGVTSVTDRLVVR